MSQRAFVSNYKNVRGTENVNEMSITFDCMLLEETVADAFTREVSIVTQWADNNATIKAKIIAAILALAAENNYNALTSTNIVLPAYVKG